MDSQTHYLETFESTSPGAIETALLWAIRIASLPFLMVGLLVWALIVGLIVTGRLLWRLPERGEAQTCDPEAARPRAGPISTIEQLPREIPPTGMMSASRLEHAVTTGSRKPTCGDSSPVPRLPR